MIEMKNYSLSLGDFSLKDINLHINEEEIFAVIGITGAGKSILLESLAGLHTSDEGEVLYRGVNVDTIDMKDRKIGFVYQDYALFPHMNVYENIEFGLKMHKVGASIRKAKVESIMEELHINHLAHRYPSTLSGGESQRSALARALVLEPEVLFMDEPFSALDPNTREDMYALIKKIHEKFRCTIIFVTHNFDEAQVLADRIGIMIKGQIRSIRDARDLFTTDETDQEVKAFLGRRDDE